jgi:hypothetical protein
MNDGNDGFFHTQTEQLIGIKPSLVAPYNYLWQGLLSYLCWQFQGRFFFYNSGSKNGGDSSAVELTNVTEIYSTLHAFAALKTDGSDVT